MTRKIETRPSLAATAILGGLGGAFLGYGAGSGIEDLLEAFSVNFQPYVGYIKPTLMVLGGIGISTLGTLQYFNKDKYKGKLVVNILDTYGMEPVQIKPEQNLEGLAHFIENLTCGIHNQNVTEVLYSKSLDILQKSPLHELRISYDYHKHSFFANQFDVFTPFSIDNREIDPKKALEDFFDNEDKLRELIVEKISDTAGNIVNKQGSLRTDKSEINKIISSEIKLAQDIALWITYLSHREGIVGSTVRNKLTQLGITDANYLAQDVKVLGYNILKLYNCE